MIKIKRIVFFSLLLFPFIAQNEKEIQHCHHKLEQLRQRSFKQPISVGTKTPEEFRAYLQSFLEKEITSDRNAFLSQTFQWLGLAEVGFDYRKKLLDTFEKEATAYYDMYSKSFFFLQKEYLRHDLKPIIIHELQHGLQDQYYSLEKYFQTALKSESEDLLSAFRFLVEGEASLVMNWYMLEEQSPHSSAPEVLHQLLSLEIEGDSEVANPQSTLKIQDYFLSTLYAPYLQGMFTLSHAYKSGNWELIHQLFLSPPTTTEQMLHFPEKYLQQRDHPTRITWSASAVCEALNQAVASKKKSVLFSAGPQTTFGEFGLYCVIHHLLKNRTEAKQISEGWDGDCFQMLQQDGNTAFFWILSFDQEEDATEALNGISSLIERWKEQMPSVEHRISQQSKEVILTAIDPTLSELFHQQIRTHYQTTEDRRGFHLRNQICPACHSVHILPIIYGMPDSELLEQAKRGEVSLGGCCITDAQYHCQECKKQW